LILLLFWWTI